MDWIASADMLGALDRSTVTFNEKNCLHSLWKFSNCEACLDVCPTSVIHPGKPPTLDHEKCASCLACLRACPVDAFQANDAIPALLNCLAQSDHKQIELICSRHSHPEQGLPGSDAAIQIRGCLAGIGTGGYLALAALGIEKTTARLDDCRDCEWGSLFGRIDLQIRQAAQLLEPWGLVNGVAASTGEQAGLENERPVIDADNPPLTRRDLFRMAARQGRLASARVLNQKENSNSRRHPTKDRRRIVAALRHLPARNSAEAAYSLAGLGFGEIQISEACTACGLCANVCPSETLEFHRDETNHFNLSYTPAYCIACGLCVEACTAGAITLNTDPTLATPFGADQTVLIQQGSLIRCESCSTWMAFRPGMKFCTLCEFRRKNPLGSKMPPGINLRR